MAISDIEGALFKGVSDFLVANALAATSIAWPNVDFDPAGKAIWAQVSHVPNEPAPVTLGDGGQDRGTGFVQVDFNVPWNTGLATLRSWENLARSAFPAGKTFSQNGQFVRVVQSGMGQIRKIDNWARRSFTIRYRFEINRSTT